MSKSHKNIEVKKRKKKINSFGIMSLALIIFAGVALLIYTNAAPNSSLSVSPNSGTVVNGSNITVGVYEDSGNQAVNSVSVKMSYDVSKLQFVNVSTSGSAFTGGCADKSASNGVVSIACFILPSDSPSSVTGKKLIANVTFTAKVSSGTTTIAFLKESDENSGIFIAGTGENIWNGVTSGGTYTLGGTTPPPGGGGGGGSTTPPPTGGGGGTSTPTTGTSGGSKTTPKTTTTAPPTSGGGTTTTPPVDNSNSGSFSTGTPTDSSSAAGETAATTNPAPKKMDTNTIIIYAAVVGGTIAILSASGVAFSKYQRRSKFNRAHGITNSAVVFDANTSVHNPQTNSIDQGPIVTPSAPTPPAPSVTTKGPEGNIITPNDDKPAL